MTTKIEKQKVVHEEEVIVDVLCNICGCSLKMGLNYEGLITTLCGGYDSILGDGVGYSFAIYEGCLRDKVFTLFMHEPDVDDHGYIGGDFGCA